MSYLAPVATASDHLERVERRLRREQTGRREAERLLESKSLELFEASQQLTIFNNELEERVRLRTAELEQAREAAIMMLATDHLTGACSRRQYAESLESAIMMGERIALLLIDLDDFKGVNDRLGHQVGDALLVQVAEKLRGASPAGDLVARVGGDEFAVIVHLRGDDEAGAIESYLAALQGQVVAFGHTLPCNVSVGLAIAPDDACSAKDLQRFADIALYKVKRAGKAGMARFKPDMLHAYDERQQLELKLRAAVEQDQIEVWFQPIMDLATGRMQTLECLARWQDEQDNFVSPDIFIALAERCGLIEQLSQQILHKALRSAKPWIESELVDGITVNISPLDLLSAGFTDRVLRALRATDYPSDRLILEITEGVVLQDIATAEVVMRKLRGAGVHFALDDFGSGYSNLAYLHRLPISVLKMDRSLLKDVEHARSGQAIIQHVVALCHDLNIRAVCEGVERETQAHFLSDVMCDKAQGFLYSRPAPPTIIEEILRNHNGVASQLDLTS